jgi:hypothetical protein
VGRSFQAQVLETHGSWRWSRLFPTILRNQRLYLLCTNVVYIGKSWIPSIHSKTLLIRADGDQ